MRIFLIILASLLGGAFFIQAADRYVSPPGGYGTNNPPYASWADAATNIQWAVNAAAAGEIVYVTNGSYCVTNQIAVSNRIILKSVNGYTNTLVYAAWPAYTNVRCFYVTGTGVVDGFTVSNGHATSWATGGGGAYITVNGMVQNCYFVNNVCSNGGTYAGGGAICISSSGGIVSNCLIFSNMSYKVAGGEGHDGFAGGVMLYGAGSVLNSTIISNYSSGYYGGGLYTYTGAGQLVSNCLIACNFADNNGSAGGIMLEGGLVIDCVIRNNQATGGNQAKGGGVQAYGGTRVVGCTIVNNTAKYGAGIYTTGYISNCVVAGNKSTGGSSGYSGGGILAAAGVIDGCRISNNFNTYAPGGGGVMITNAGQLRNSLICNNTNIALDGGVGGGGVLIGNISGNTSIPYGVVNCTIVNNYSTNEGGGITVIGVSNYIANCIISGNGSSSNKYPDVYNREANSNNFFFCCANVTSAPLAPNQGNITNNPLFAGPSSGNWRLNPSSPCVNTGTNQGWMTNSVDLDGRMRIRYGTVDLGAYETIYDGTILKF